MKNYKTNSESTNLLKLLSDSQIKFSDSIELKEAIISWQENGNFDIANQTVDSFFLRDNIQYLYKKRFGYYPTTSEIEDILGFSIFPNRRIEILGNMLNIKRFFTRVSGSYNFRYRTHYYFQPRDIFAFLQQHPFGCYVLEIYSNHKILDERNISEENHNLFSSLLEYYNKIKDCIEYDWILGKKPESQSDISDELLMLLDSFKKIGHFQSIGQFKI